MKKVAGIIGGVKEVSEHERNAVERVLADRFTEGPGPVEGFGGSSPYSPETIVFRGDGTETRGTRVALAAVCRSHNGAGHYKGRGRWRMVAILVQNSAGDFVVCDATDRESEQVGCTNIYVRSWAVHEDEEKTGGLGRAAGLLEAALADVGL